MKYSYCSKRLFVAMFVLLVIAGCKKENLAKNFTGSYTGTAIEKLQPDLSVVKTYTNCKIVISGVDRKKIRLTITRDPSDPSSQFYAESMVQDANHFKDFHGGQRAQSTSYEGSLQSRELIFKMETNFMGSVYQFQFQGLRD
jgi:hypothetical protein